jgi:curved DNA-binding protein CbpA
MKDYYKILGTDKKASVTEIKKQFRIKALLTHPDKTKKDTRVEFIEVYEAYAVLSDKKKRAEYDRLYDLFFPSTADVREEELKIDLRQIEEKAKVYADNFRMFDKEILGLLLFELFFSVDDLLFASLVTIIFGLWTIGKGLMAMDFGYSMVGLGLTLVGLFFGRLKVNRVIKTSR